MRQNPPAIHLAGCLVHPFHPVIIFIRERHRFIGIYGGKGLKELVINERLILAALRWKSALSPKQTWISCHALDNLEL